MLPRLCQATVSPCSLSLLPWPLLGAMLCSLCSSTACPGGAVPTAVLGAGAGRGRRRPDGALCRAVGWGQDLSRMVGRRAWGLGLARLTRRMQLGRAARSPFSSHLPCSRSAFHGRGCSRLPPPSAHWVLPHSSHGGWVRGDKEETWTSVPIPWHTDGASGCLMAFLGSPPVQPGPERISPRGRTEQAEHC